MQLMDKKSLVQAVSDEHNADVLVYSGHLFQPSDINFASLVRAKRKAAKKKNKNCLLVLTTPGGSADCAYRIARCLQRSYRTYLGQEDERGALSIYVPLFCKSAGTILALGADAIIMSQLGELGPIDAQLLKPDEIGERTSGLTAVGSFQLVEKQALSSFRSFFLDMRFRPDLRFPTKLAAETAAEMTIGLFKPIVRQIDPMRFAEIERSIMIAYEYGRRLCTSNVEDGAVESLTVGYPSHGFIIDRREAKDLFRTVSKPSDGLEDLGGLIVEEALETNVLADVHARPIVEYLNVEENENVEAATCDPANSDQSAVGS